MVSITQWKHPNHEPYFQYLHICVSVSHCVMLPVAWSNLVSDSLCLQGPSCGMKFLREFIFSDWPFFCLLWELIFVIWTEWFFLLGITFCYFQEVPFKCIDNIFVVIEDVQSKNRFKSIPCVYKTSCINHCHSITTTSGAPGVSNCSSDD